MSEWQSPEEQNISNEINQVDLAFEQAEKDYEKEVNKLKEMLSAEQKKSDKNYRILLTGDGEELKKAVISALSAFGFKILDVDTTRNKSDLLEDLHITQNDTPDWLAISEVRSHKGGAQSGDLLKIGRQWSRYQKEHNGEEPSCAWYIVNHSRNKSPSERHLAMKDNKDDANLFAESYEGLIIDTTVLFKLWMDLLDGSRTAAEIIKLLVSSKGILDYKDKSSVASQHKAKKPN